MIHSVTFSASNAFMAVGLSEGFAVYTTNPLSRIVHCTYGRLSTSSVVASPRRSIAVFRGIPGQPSFSEFHVCAYDWQLDKPVKNLRFATPVLRIVSDSDLCALVFEAEVHIYTLEPFRVTLMVESLENPAAPCALAERSGERLFALTGRSLGVVRVVSVDRQECKPLEFEAADHPLAMIRFNPTAEAIATASERGTLIRVFNSRTGDRIAEFRRGSFGVRICAITFSPRSDFVAVFSEKGTLHLFEMLSAGNAGEAVRAVGQWKMDPYQPATVEFVSSGMLAVIQFNDGELRLLRTTTDGRKISTHSQLRLADIDTGGS
jgi:WD40 repeat protein